MIVDCFTFMNEREILKARVALLEETVDRFVIVEADSTFQGDSRRPVFPDVRPELLGLPDDRIRYIQVSNLPVKSGPWACERFLRDQIAQGLDDVPDEALILIGDADEIIRPEVIRLLESSLVEPTALEVRYFTFRVNWEWINPRSDPRAVRKRDLGSPHDLRRRKGLPVISDAGWHVSWLGDAEAARGKLRSFSHTEMRDLLDSPKHIETCIRLGVDLLGRGVLHRVSDLDVLPTFPRGEFPELWAQRRSPTGFIYAHLWNFAIPAMRQQGLPSDRSVRGGIYAALALRLIGALKLLRFTTFLARLSHSMRRRATERPEESE